MCSVRTDPLFLPILLFLLILSSYWSFSVRTVPTNLLFPTVRTDPLHLLILLFLPILCSYWSYCSYRSSVPTDPTVPTDPMFLLILLFVLFLTILCSYWSCVPTDPLFLLFPTYWSSDPNVSTDPLSYWSSVPIPTYWSSAPTVPTDPPLLLVLCSYYWSFFPKMPVSLLMTSVRSSSTSNKPQ